MDKMIMANHTLSNRAPKDIIKELAQTNYALIEYITMQGTLDRSHTAPQHLAQQHDNVAEVSAFIFKTYE